MPARRPDQRRRGANRRAVTDRIPRNEQLQHEACRRIIMGLADRGPGLRDADTLPRFFDTVRAICPPVHSGQLGGILSASGDYDTVESNLFVYAEKVRR